MMIRRIALNIIKMLGLAEAFIVDGRFFVKEPASSSDKDVCVLGVVGAQYWSTQC